jgi:hypothetical protein
MVADRLNGLALLHIHRDVNVDRVKILDEFDTCNRWIGINIQTKALDREDGLSLRSWQNVLQRWFPVEMLHFGVGRHCTSQRLAISAGVIVAIVRGISLDARKTIFFRFESSKAMEQNNNGRGQTKRTSIIAHSQRRKCWQGQNTRQIWYG